MSRNVHAGRSLFRIVGGTGRWVVLSSILGIVTIGSGIGLMAMATSLLTRSALIGSAATISLAILGVRFFAITRVTGRYLDRYLGHLGTFRVLTRVRVWFFASLVRSDSIERSSGSRGDLVTALVDDVETMQDRLLRVSSPPFVALGALAIGVSAILFIDPPAAVILAAVFLVQAIALPPLLSRRTQRVSVDLVALQAERNTRATEFLEGIETLSMWGRVDLLEESMATLDASETPLRRSLTFTRAGVDGVIILLTGGCVIAILAILRSAASPSSEIWWLAATPLITLATFEALGPLLSRPEHRARTDAAADRILKMTSARSAPVTPRSTSESPAPVLQRSEPSIDFESVSFSYDGNAKVFEHASISIPFGTTVAITAPSGTGKSTFLDLVLGFLDTDSGVITVGGSNPAEHAPGRAPIVAAVLQDDHVFDTTVRDNLLVGDGDADDQRLLTACALAGLSSFLDEREEGLDAPIGPDGASLSGGERQRLMIARALVCDAPILFLDEATEHLETEMRASIVTAILEARTGRTTVFLSHDLEARTRADAIYEIRNGSFIRRQS